MQRAEGFGQSPPYVIQGGPSDGDKGPGDRDDGLRGHRTSKQHYRGRESRRPPSSLMKYWRDFKCRGGFFFLHHIQASSLIKRQRVTHGENLQAIFLLLSVFFSRTNGIILSKKEMNKKRILFWWCEKYFFSLPRGTCLQDRCKYLLTRNTQTKIFFFFSF